MRTKAITAVVFMVMVTFVGINLSAAPGDWETRYATPTDFAPKRGEKVLDLSKPENRALLVGQWEGHWQSGAVAYGEIMYRYALDPKNEERPILRWSRRRPPGILGAPDTWAGPARPRIENGRLEFVGFRTRETGTLYQRPDGTLVYRSRTWSQQDSAPPLDYVAYKLEPGQVSKFFPEAREVSAGRGPQIEIAELIQWLEEKGAITAQEKALLRQGIIPPVVTTPKLIEASSGQ